AGEKDAIQKLFEDVAPRYAERQGGYTRIMKVGPRRGDGAEVVIIELV
ncbi:MAG: 50S ribosomal protein L17, partial [Exiguobacterium sp.]|nr:50S ribosomal protein L17 [Exiguobacterium sp.]MDX5424604.1 50S ribosomal protein L17 [Exiguobacterium sp.]MDX6772098.1 50S ribosomal protein L17 [Exiguobacterium sp.]